MTTGLPANANHGLDGLYFHCCFGVFRHGISPQSSELKHTLEGEYEEENAFYTYINIHSPPVSSLIEPD